MLLPLSMAATPDGDSLRFYLKNGKFLFEEALAQRIFNNSIQMVLGILTIVASIQKVDLKAPMTKATLIPLRAAKVVAAECAQTTFRIEESMEIIRQQVAWALQNSFAIFPEELHVVPKLWLAPF